MDDCTSVQQGTEMQTRTVWQGNVRVNVRADGMLLSDYVEFPEIGLGVGTRATLEDRPFRWLSLQVDNPLIGSFHRMPDLD